MDLSSEFPEDIFYVADIVESSQKSSYVFGVKVMKMRSFKILYANMPIFLEQKAFLIPSRSNWVELRNYLSNRNSWFRY